MKTLREWCQLKDFSFVALNPFLSLHSVFSVYVSMLSLRFHSVDLWPHRSTSRWGFSGLGPTPGRDLLPLHADTSTPNKQWCERSEMSRDVWEHASSVEQRPTCLKNPQLPKLFQRFDFFLHVFLIALRLCRLCCLLLGYYSFKVYLLLTECVADARLSPLIQVDGHLVISRFFPSWILSVAFVWSREFQILPQKMNVSGMRMSVFIHSTFLYQVILWQVTSV